jgi:hypothetical protein
MDEPEILVEPIKQIYVYSTGRGKPYSTIIYRATFINDEEDLGAEGWGGTPDQAVAGLRQGQSLIFALQSVMER